MGRVRLMTRERMVDVSRETKIWRQSVSCETRGVLVSRRDDRDCVLRKTQRAKMRVLFCTRFGLRNVSCET